MAFTEKKKIDKLVLFKVKTICKLKTSYRLGKSIGKSHIRQGTLHIIYKYSQNSSKRRCNHFFSKENGQKSLNRHKK